MTLSSRAVPDGLVEELRAKLDGRLPGFPRVDAPRSARPQYALYEHELRQILDEADRAKSRGDNHWETLRGIRDIARTTGDLERIILWVNDAGSGYVERPEATIAALTDRATTAERERDEAMAALREKEERVKALEAGWKLMPPTPTDEMLAACDESKPENAKTDAQRRLATRLRDDGRRMRREDYLAMFAAAPALSSGQHVSGSREQRGNEEG